MFLALFWAYIGQPDNHIGWVTLMPLKSINPCMSVPIPNGKCNKSDWDSFFQISLGLNTLPGSCAMGGSFWQKDSLGTSPHLIHLPFYNYYVLNCTHCEMQCWWIPASAAVRPPPLKESVWEPGNIDLDRSFFNFGSFKGFFSFLERADFTLRAMVSSSTSSSSCAGQWPASNLWKSHVMWIFV